MCGRGFVVRMRYPINTRGTHLGQIVVFCPRHTRGEAPRVKSLVFINVYCYLCVPLGGLLALLIPKGRTWGRLVGLPTRGVAPRSCSASPSDEKW